MNRNSNFIFLMVLTLFMLVSPTISAQEKQKLQEKREKLQREIKEINRLLSKNKKTKKNDNINKGTAKTNITIFSRFKLCTFLILCYHYNINS